MSHNDAERRAYDHVNMARVIVIARLTGIDPRTDNTPYAHEEWERLMRVKELLTEVANALWQGPAGSHDLQHKIPF